jgi:hypothetical protein
VQAHSKGNNPLHMCLACPTAMGSCSNQVHPKTYRRTKLGFGIKYPTPTTRFGVLIVGLPWQGCNTPGKAPQEGPPPPDPPPSPKP